MSQYESQELTQYLSQEAMPSRKRNASAAGLPQGGIKRTVAKDHQKLAKLSRMVSSNRNRAYLDQIGTSASLTTTGAIHSLIAIPTTADVAAYARRIGDAITVTGMDLAIVFRGTETGAILYADAYNNIGMRLAWVNNPNGGGLPAAVSNSRTAFFDTSGATADAGVLLPPVGFDLRPDLSIVQEKVFNLAGLDTSAIGVVNVKEHTATFHRRYKFNKRVIFNSTVNASTSIEKGLLCLGFTGDSAASPSPTYSYQARIYYDM